jgi:polyisoprenoid-binding protein YceI
MLCHSLVRVAVCSAIVVSGATLLHAADALKLDAKKSKIEFVGKKTGGQHSGGFKKFTAEARVDIEKPTEGTLEIEIDATSIFSDDEKLTNHLKNDDFFDIRKYPKIIFKSKKIETKDEKATMIAELTMLGETVEIEVPVEAEMQDSSIKINAAFEIDRTKWGMDYGVGKVKKEVEIRVELVFVR